MAHTDVANTFVGVPKLTGGIWRYAQSVTLPTDAYTARPAGYTRLGGVSDDGVTWMSERDTTQKFDWNGDKVRKIQSSKDDSFKITYIEFLNPAIIAEVYGDDNVDVVDATTSHGTLISAKANAEILGHYAYIVDTFDDNVKKRRVIPDAQVDSVDDVEEKPGDWSVYTVTYDLFPDSQGNTSYIYYELDDRLVPSEWDVTITGSAGTYIHTVDGSSTTALAYNASTATVDTALELLPTVGAGNATVTGSASAYTVVLANGGVLSSVGSGGATVGVVPG